ncbi:hypothetical protein ElyMa_005060300 [Elysia marginata]|uniref:DUF6160 domain-containing protein n=1 Tax=Elysia marginata TaxID=1093978 RepID=A0AAV4JFM2_9GAST|nr:hypothetical protein ElyMa_005060300 [Elysia marginata]
MKGLKKLPLAIAISSVMAATAQAELKALEDEAMSEMTGQSGITVEIEMKATVGEVKYTDEGSITLEGITLHNDADPDDLLKQKIEIDLLENNDLAAATQAKASGDAVQISISETNMDVEVDAIRTGVNSLGAIEIDDLKMDGTTLTVYSLKDSKGIGVDAVINQEIGRLAITDVDGANNVAGDKNGGTVALNSIDVSSLDMTGTEITVVDGADNAFGTNDAVKISMPGINGGKITVGGIQLGSATGDGYDRFDQTIGSVNIEGLDLAGSDMYVYAPDSGSGIRVTQTLNASVSEVTYVAGVLDATEAALVQTAMETEFDTRGYTTYADAGAAATAYGTAMTDIGTFQAMGAQQAIIDTEVAGGVDPADPATHTAEYTDAVSQQATLAGTLSGDYLDVNAAIFGATSAAARQKQFAAAGSYYGSGSSRTGDGVGSVSLENVSIVADTSTIAVDVNSSNELVIGAPMTNANLTVGSIRVGDGNLGGLSVSGLNIATNNIKIYGH